MCVIIFENRTPLKPVLRNVCIVYLSITGKEQTQSNRDFFFFFFSGLDIFPEPICPDRVNTNSMDVVHVFIF